MVNFLAIWFLLITISVSAQLSAQDINVNARLYNSGAKGYYFLHTYKMNKDNPLKKPFQLIINEKGELIYKKEMSNASDFKLHWNGVMSYYSNGKFFLLDSNFILFDSISCVNAIETDSHDFLILPNGNYVLLGTESFTMDLSNTRIFLKKGEKGSKNASVKCGVIQELNPSKELLFQWYARPYFELEKVSAWYLMDTLNVDITHFNSIDYCPDGNLLISARYFNEVFKLRKSDGKIMWRLGGPYANIRIMNDSVPFLGQHDAREIAPNRITLFDNGFAGSFPGHGARSLEYEIDTISRTAKLRWQYTYNASLIGEATGNSHRMANGNTLVNFGKVRNGIPNITFVVVDSTKKLLLEVSFPDTIGTYRTWGYTNLPRSLMRPHVIFERISKDSFLLSTDYKSDEYKWSNGSVGNSIKARKGNYFVYVRLPDGAWLRSEEVNIR